MATDCQKEDTPTTDNPVLKHCMIIRPMKQPTMVPLPPVKATPPSTAAVIASKSAPEAAVGAPVCILAARMMPTRAPMAELST